MPVVRLRAPLATLTGGIEHEVEGTTVAEALAALERAHPPLAGWILDEQGRIREHVNVFVNRLPAQERDSIFPGDLVQVLPSITGG